MKTNLLKFFASGLIVFALFFVAFKAVPVNAGNDEVTICHATDSNSNPYVINTPDKSGDVDGHDNHNGPIWYLGIPNHTKWGDIIPPFTYTHNGQTKNYSGKNWDSQGQTIWDNDCEIPSSTPTPTPNGSPTPTPTPTPTSTPVNHYACNVDRVCTLVQGPGANTCNPENEDSDCQSQTPTPTPTPTPTATPTTSSNPGVGGPGDGRSDNQGCSTHDCSGNKASTSQGGQVLGASTGPTQAVLGLSSTSGESGESALPLIQLVGAFGFTSLGFGLFKKHA